MSKTVKFRIKSQSNPIKISPIYDPNWTPQVYVPHGSGISGQILQQGISASAWQALQGQTQHSSLTQAAISAQHQQLYGTPPYYTFSTAPVIGQEIEVSEEFLDQIVKYIFEKKSQDNFQKMLLEE